MINYFTIADDSYFFEVNGAERAEIQAVNDITYPLLYSGSPIYKVNMSGKTYIRAIAKSPKDRTFSFCLTIENGELHSSGANINIIKNECVYLVFIRSAEDVYLVKRDILRLRNETVTTTIFNNHITNINIATTRTNASFPLSELCDCEVVSTHIGGYAYVIVTADRGDKKQLLLFSVGDNTNIILSTIADDFIWSNEYLIKSEKLADTQGRVKKSYYKLLSRRAELVKFEFTYAYPTIYPSELIIYDFLDAISAEDYEYAKNAVTDELKEGLSTLRDFIGEISDVITPAKLDLIPHQLKVLVKDKTLTLKIISFEFVGSKISNIEVVSA